MHAPMVCVAGCEADAGTRGPVQGAGEMSGSVLGAGNEVVR